MSVVFLRYVISFSAASTVVFLLFWLMQFLISIADRSLDASEAGALLEFVRVPKAEELNTKKKLKPKKPPQPGEPPPIPPSPALDDVTPDNLIVSVSAINVNTSINLSASGFGLTPSDGEYLPIVKVQPIYPRRALSRNIEGYVIVEFTVTKQGATKNHVVVEAKPSGIFDRAAIQATTKFKYKPRVVDGEPIEVSGVQNIIRFQIED